VFDRSDGQQSHISKLGAPLLGGLCAGVPCSMLEFIMVQQQNKGGSIVTLVPEIINKFGITALFRGMTTTVAREGLFTMSMLGVTPGIQAELVARFQLNDNVALAAGAVCGSLFATTISHPIDTIKTCMQGDIERVKYNNVLQTRDTLIKEHGVARGLFKGMHWRFAQISVGFFFLNKFKTLLAPIVFKDKIEKKNPSAGEIIA
jgi:solute carrier family 25 (mitochondrial carnitine/acylcarnitine transporter), member 20/29